jgi:hypothetical protein
MLASTPGFNGEAGLFFCQKSTALRPAAERKRKNSNAEQEGRKTGENAIEMQKRGRRPAHVK